MFESQYSSGLPGNRIGINARVPGRRGGAKGVVPSSRTTGSGQGQKANVLKKIKIRSTKLVLGFFMQIKATKTAK